MHLRDQDGGWLNPEQILAEKKRKEEENKKWDQLYAQEEDEGSFELVQFNHENDTDDIPDGMNPNNVGGIESLVQLR